MSAGGYGDLAEAYDALTFNVPYDEIAEYYINIIERFTDGKSLLDMGCGTGNLTVRLAERGFEVIGQDASVEMLSIAAEKSRKVRWICQSMDNSALPAPVNVIVSTLDSLNHLPDKDALQRCFGAAADSLIQGGVFVFDVNTVYKHREILAENTFVYDVDGVYCVWQNTFDPADNGVTIDLDLFFEEEDGSYTRGEEHFREIAFPEGTIRGMLESAGFETAAVYDYLTFDEPGGKTEKLLFAALKK